MYITKQDDTKIFIGPTDGDYLRLVTHSGSGYLWVRVGNLNTGLYTDYDPQSIKNDPSTPQKYSCSPIQPPRFNLQLYDFNSNSHNHALNDASDSLTWSVVGGVVHIAVIENGKSSDRARLYPDVSSNCGTVET